MSETATACPHCGEPASSGSRFCEACGRPIGGGDAVAAPPTAPGEAAPLDELGSGPISAPTHVSPVSVPPSPGRRPCAECGGVVGPDGYCEMCGTKAPSERDHFREQPASWVAGVCDKGVVHARNEDAMALLASERPGERAVLVVLDGVSSSADSDVASLAGARAAREVLRTPLPRGMGTPQSRASATAKVLVDATTAANEAVIEATDASSANPASATFAVAVLEGTRLAFANVGDSRAYWLPDAGPGVQLTVDDSGAQAQIEAGVPRREAETSAQAHAITKWLGRDAHDVTPRVGERELGEPGWVLVCSDGLWNYASEPQELQQQIRASGATEAGALALALTEFANGRGGRDNITVALARVEPGSSGQNQPTEDQDQERMSDG